MEQRYKKISEYGAIGNLRSVALIGIDGAIDWCCFPGMSDSSVFAALLDHERGGTFRVHPSGMKEGRQQYIEGTNILETTFAMEDGYLRMTDFLPLHGDIEGTNTSRAPTELHRIVQCEAGRMEVEVLWAPRFDYARETTHIREAGGGFIGTGGGDSLVLAGCTGGRIIEEGGGPAVRARLQLTAGDRIALVTRWNSIDFATDVHSSLHALEETVKSWHGWLYKEEATGSRTWARPWSKEIVRSELVLKMMTYASTGAIAAAPTTSLPETIGGVRNWDYRYTWIRDAALTGQALLAMGHRAEATDFLHLIESLSEKAGESGKQLQIMYGLKGEFDLPEEELPHLEGYRMSSPVRIGNKASEQIQLDIYGELMNSAFELVRLGERLEPPLCDFLSYVADEACASWRDPDFGIWEFRAEPRQFVYSKAMLWAALDRAILLSEDYGLLNGDTRRWQETAHLLQQYVLTEGFDLEADSFVQSVGTRHLDASNLLIPMLELLPFDDYRVQATINQTLAHLTEDGMVYRYSNDDGLPGKEGTFAFCSFWLVDALAFSGRLDEAYEIFEGMVGRQNHLGLFSEQIEAYTGEFLGNFPQAFTHIGLINSALNLKHAEGEETPLEAPIGSPAHRAGS